MIDSLRPAPAETHAARRRLGTALLAVGGVAAALAVMQSAPALAAIAPLRRRWLPELSGLGRPGHVALTFDDGPDPRTTPMVLEILRAHGLRATFFVLGEALARVPDLGRRMVGEGHEVAVHGYRHRLLLYRGVGAVRDDLGRARDLVERVTGVAPRWYRPPYGVATTSALVTARRLGLAPMLWSTWGRDWTCATTPESVLATVRATLTGGGTVLLHDSDEHGFPGATDAMIAALPHVIRYADRAGYVLGPLAEHRTAEPLPVNG
ncbi:polysaccharide deacetylase family protein [Hamadaea tsunoensis]|uniref:polysaccharide deacetylase family protein n=1 Tax=Hamadaea tsunoensis TaxID=53368 RepID=UPI00041A1A65|nr:polysaccharide deacetylase family protein [Hamadaea tsunoensis]